MFYRHYPLEREFDKMKGDCIFDLLLPRGANPVTVVTNPQLEGGYLSPQIPGVHLSGGELPKLRRYPSFAINSTSSYSYFFYKKNETLF